MNLNRRLLASIWVLFALSGPVATAEIVDTYNQIKSFELGPQTAALKDFVLERDRVRITLTGTVQFVTPVLDQVTGAVFTGSGRVSVEPWSKFEAANVRRLLKAETVDTDFKSAVFRFTDDTHSVLMGASTGSPALNSARGGELTEKLEERLLRENGFDLSTRLLISLIHEEKPGVFFGEFTGGDRDRFGVIIDHQGRLLSEGFGIDAGEKGLLFKNHEFDTEVWTAFYNEADFERGSVTYSTVFDLVHVTDYEMDVDLTKPGDWLRLKARLSLTALQDGVRVVPFNINDGLSHYQDSRVKRGVKPISAKAVDGGELPVIFDRWQKGFAVVLPESLAKGGTTSIEIEFEGKDSLLTHQATFHYPRSTTTWYPRHGDLARSKFDIRFRHQEKTKVVSVGQRLSDGEPTDDPKIIETRWKMSEPVALVSFAVGKFERHEEVVELLRDKRKLPIEYYSLPSEFAVIKEDFLVTELANCAKIFDQQFGAFEYERLGAVFFPRGYGQGFPTMLLLPSSGRSDKYQFSFIAHEAAHQWWGNIVGWRTYRDQWMSEGFAEYSGMLYTGLRQKRTQMLDLVRESRRELIEPPSTTTGILGGTVMDIGPLILGHRNSSRQSQGAYSTLIYQKGALVLRMIHMLLTDPSSGSGEPFYEMMRDFVGRFRNTFATTEDFQAVASEHFAKTALAKKYQLKDLQWFFREWVFGTGFPEYRLEYAVTKLDGKPALQGTIFQEGMAADSFMPIPLFMDFGGDQVARTIVLAYGPQREFTLALPSVPKSVVLDPDMWVLSKSTSTKKVKAKKRD